MNQQSSYDYNNSYFYNLSTPDSPVSLNSSSSLNNSYYSTNMNGYNCWYSQYYSTLPYNYYSNSYETAPNYNNSDSTQSSDLSIYDNSLQSSINNNSYYQNNSSYNLDYKNNEYSTNLINNNEFNNNVCYNNYQETVLISPIEPKKAKANSNRNIDKMSKKHQLPDEAVDIMDEWFYEHINNPYPTPEEKERLAQKGGITIKQVTAWFSNRRNRSQNTKPKRMKRVLEKEMCDIYNDLISSQNKEHVIQKLKNTLVNHDIGLNSNPY